MLGMRGSDLILGISLANMWCIRMWGEVLAISGTDAYFSSVSNADILALMTNVLLLGGLFAAAATLLRRFGVNGRRVLLAGFVVALVAQVNQLGPELNPGVLALADPWRSGRYVDVLATAAVLMALVAACIRWPSRALRLATGFVLVLAPFVVVTFGRAAYVLFRVNPSTALAADAPPITSAVKAGSGPRVVLIAFDAMGRRLAIEERPDSIQAPEFDRLRAEALDASQATQIGSVTMISVPGMLSGLDVTSARPVSNEELEITLVDGRKLKWSKQGNLLAEAQAQGGVGVVVGWYHPYCRLFDNVDACVTYPARSVGSRARATGFRRALVEQQMALIPFVAIRLRQIEIVQQQREDMVAAVKHGGGGFVFLHLIAPHTPWIWDSATDAYSLTEFAPDGIFGNIELADHMLGEIRRAMESEGQWEQSAVIVTSDHVENYRPKWLDPTIDKRVPLIVKLPGAGTGVAYDRPIRALVVHDLASALLRGEIATYEALTSWLDAYAPTSAVSAAPNPR